MLLNKLLTVILHWLAKSVVEKQNIAKETTFLKYTYISDTCGSAADGVLNFMTFSVVSNFRFQILLIRTNKMFKCLSTNAVLH